MRVVLTDGSTMVFRNPSMSGDTLVGTADLARTASTVRVAIPVTQIRTLSISKFSPLRTTGLVLVLGVAAFAAFVFWS